MIKSLLSLGFLFVIIDKIASQCTPLLVDNYSSLKTTNLNSIGGWASDDGSMTSVTVSGTNLILRSKSASSYFYETGFCAKSLSNTVAKGWQGVQFAVKAPTTGQVTLAVNLQTGCQTIKNNYQTITIPAGANQTLKLDFSTFTGADLTQVSAISFEGLQPVSVDINFSPITFYCSQSPPPPPPPPGVCSADLIVEDMLDPQRFSFLGYNALVPPGAFGHAGTMKSAVMSGRRLTLTRASASAYLYSTTNCMDVSRFAGISFPIAIPSGGTVSVALEYGSAAGCGGTPATSGTVNLVTNMGVPANGVETVVSIPFSRFSGVNTKFVNSIVFSGFTSASAYRLGAIRFYCQGSSLTPPPVPPADVLPTIPAMPKPYPVGTGGTLVIENFVSRSPTSNALGGWHGGEIPVTYNTNSTATFRPGDSEQSFYTQLPGYPCSDLSKYRNSYLRVVASYSSTQNFEIVLEQQNQFCDTNRSPSPATYSQVSSSVYRVGTTREIYIPISHFNVASLNRVGNLVFRGFRITESVLFSRVEIVNSVPSTVTNLPGKQPEIPLTYECTVPNTVAFGIDDGDPALAPTVFSILKEENVKATFFLLGNPLLDSKNGLAAIYKQAAADGHQIGYHSYSHPYFPTLVNNWEVDRQLNLAIQAVSNATGVTPASLNYFRAPFGVIDSRLRRRLAERKTRLIQWSIDVEDYLWGTSPTPSKQLDAFNRDLNAGGSLVVTHYLYNSTAVYLRDFIRAAKAAGKRVVRIDQCLGDPAAPPI